MNVRYFFNLVYIFCLVSLSVVVCAENFFIDNIEILGLKHVSEKKFINNLKVASGLGCFSSNKIIDTLYKLEVFDDIQVYRKGSNFNINVVERPYIGKIKIYGEKNRKHIYVILSEHDVKVGEIYKYDYLELAKQKIEQYYINNGTHNVGVNFVFNYNKNLGHVYIDINICKRDKQRIKKIGIIGNKVFREKKILNLLSHSKTNWMSWFSSDDIFFKGKLLSDLENVKSYYVDRGYINFQINTTKIFLSKNKHDIYIMLTVSEGEKYYIGDLDINGDILDFNSKLKSIIFSYIDTGDVFSRKKLLNTRKNLKEYFNSKGYMNANVEFSLINVGNNVINIDFTFSRSFKVMVRQVDFVGNFLTVDSVLRKSIPQMEGTWISVDEINFGKEEILRCGLAANVGVEFVNYSDKKEQIDIIYRLEEQKTTKFMIGCSYNYGDGLILNIGSELSNFLGSGKDINFSINRNNSQADYTFGYYNPHLTNSGIGVGYNIYHKAEQLDRSSGNFDHATNTFGAYLYYSFRVGKYKKFNFGFGCDMTKLKLYEETAPREMKSFIAREGLDFKEYFFTSVFTYNSLDKSIFPSNGMSQRFTLRTTLPGSTIKYYVANYDVNYFNQIFDDYIFNFCAVLGYGNKYGLTSQYPFFKNFFVKGNNNIRGFKDKTLGPRDSHGESIGGNVLVNFKIAMYFPAPIFCDMKSVRTSLFFDIGQVYNTNKSYKKDPSSKFLKVSMALRYSCGFSFIWNTPFGIPFEVSLAYPLNLKKTDKRNILAFALSMQFA